MPQEEELSFPALLIIASERAVPVPSDEPTLRVPSTSSVSLRVAYNYRESRSERTRSR